MNLYSVQSAVTLTSLNFGPERLNKNHHMCTQYINFMEQNKNISKTYILWVLDGGNGTGGQHQLFPSLAEIDDINTITTALVDVLFHLEVDIFRTQMGGGHQHLGNVVLFKGQNF